MLVALRLVDTYAAKHMKRWPPMHVPLNNSVAGPCFNNLYQISGRQHSCNPIHFHVSNSLWGLLSIFQCDQCTKRPQRLKEIWKWFVLHECTLPVIPLYGYMHISSYLCRGMTTMQILHKRAEMSKKGSDSRGCPSILMGTDLFLIVGQKAIC